MHNGYNGLRNEELQLLVRGGREEERKRGREEARKRGGTMVLDSGAELRR